MLMRVDRFPTLIGRILDLHVDRFPTLIGRILDLHFVIIKPP